MGYVLLWIENLATGLLLLATLLACISRLRRPWLRLALSVLVTVVPLYAFMIIVVGMGYFRLKEMILVPLLYPLALMTACFAIGVVRILLASLRRGDHHVIDGPSTCSRPRQRRPDLRADLRSA